MSYGIPKQALFEARSFKRSADVFCRLNTNAKYAQEELCVAVVGISLRAMLFHRFSMLAIRGDMLRLDITVSHNDALVANATGNRQDFPVISATFLFHVHYLHHRRT